MKRATTVMLATAFITHVSPPSYPASFIFAGEANGVNIITHVNGYGGFGGNINISVGIDPASPNAAAMVTSVQNIIRTFNALQPTTGNLQTENVPFDQWDFESVALHEVGHALGLGHWCRHRWHQGLRR
jgi:hypothetical protein